MTQLPATILIVDDDDDLRGLLKKALSTHGYPRVFEARDAGQALEVIGREDPDLIVLDTVLPDMDGREVCRRIKSQSLAKPKVIIYTGQEEAVDSERCARVGADAFVPKTFDFNFVLDAVGKLVPPADAGT